MKTPDDKDKPTDPSRRRFFQITGTAVAGVAAASALPPGAVTILENIGTAAPIPLAPGFRSASFLYMSNYLRAWRHLAMQQATDTGTSLLNFNAVIPDADSAYRFGRTYGSPEMFEHFNQQAYDVTKQALDLLKQVDFSPEEMAGEIEAHLGNFRSWWPGESEDYVRKQLTYIFTQSPEAAQAEIVKLAEARAKVYDQAWKHFEVPENPEIAKQRDSGAHDTFVEAMRKAKIYKGMPEARKAGGYPISSKRVAKDITDIDNADKDPRDYPESYVGNYYRKSGERYAHPGAVISNNQLGSYQGKLAPDNCIDITNS